MMKDAAMMVSVHTLARWLAPLALAGLVFTGTAHAITIGEEIALSRQFMEQARRQYEFIEDPLITGYVNAIGRRLVAVLPLQPFEYRFYVIQDDSFNAFASPAGQIFVHSGLLTALEDESELAGILAHEVAHAALRHVSQSIDKARRRQPLTLAGMAAGILLGLGGNAALGQAAVAGSTAGARSFALAHSRRAEDQADEFGVRYLCQAGFSADGLTRALKKIREKDWFEGEIPGYLSTHPPTVERLMHIAAVLDDSAFPAANQGIAATGSGFKRAQIRLMAVYGPLDRSFGFFENALKNDPEDPMALWGYGRTMMRQGRYDEALCPLRRARAADSGDPSIRTDLAKAYYRTGRYQAALESLTPAPGSAPADAEGGYYLGCALMKAGRLKQASDTLESLLQNHPDHIDAYHALGEIRYMQGLKGESHYFLGVYFKETMQSRQARFHLERALALLTDAGATAKARRVLAELGQDRLSTTAKEKKGHGRRSGDPWLIHMGKGP